MDINLTEKAIYAYYKLLVNSAWIQSELSIENPHSGIESEVLWLAMYSLPKHSFSMGEETHFCMLI